MLLGESAVSLVVGILVVARSVDIVSERPGRQRAARRVQGQ